MSQKTKEPEVELSRQKDVFRSYHYSTAPNLEKNWNFKDVRQRHVLLYINVIYTGSREVKEPQTAELAACGKHYHVRKKQLSVAAEVCKRNCIYA